MPLPGTMFYLTSGSVSPTLALASVFLSFPLNSLRFSWLPCLVSTLHPPTIHLPPCLLLGLSGILLWFQLLEATPGLFFSLRHPGRQGHRAALQPVCGWLPKLQGLCMCYSLESSSVPFFPVAMRKHSGRRDFKDQ